MAKGFKHGSSGGSALNFNVVGGTSAPSNPKENTVWVDTDTPIANWVFSTTQPVKKVDNLLSFPSKSVSKTVNGVTYTVNPDGTVVLNGTVTTSGDLKIFEPLNLDWVAGDKYTFSARHVSGKATLASGTSTTTFSWGIFQNDASKYVRGSVSLTEFPELYTFTGTAFELTATNKYYILYFQCWRPGTVFDNYTVRIQLEAGETATEPDGIAVEGTVWISTGTSSPAAFNVLKKNSVMVYPLSAKQYVSGAWVSKTAKSYQDGTWAELWDGTLYDAGNEYEFITGGWTSGNVGSTSSATPSAITKNVDHIVIPNKQSASNGAFPVNAIDLTNYTKLKAIYSGQGCSLRIAPDYPTSSATASVNGDNVGSTKTELTLDISALTGKYKPALACRTQYTTYLYKMWLE